MSVPATAQRTSGADHPVRRPAAAPAGDSFPLGNAQVCLQGRALRRTQGAGTIVEKLSFLTLQRGNAFRDAPRHTPAGLKRRHAMPLQRPFHMLPDQFRGIVAPCVQGFDHRDGGGRVAQPHGQVA
ncbi:DUF1534 domain-containing protein [Pseudomonas syringae]|nr:DUF1534 domain-containing protein [Pseudomonas syringae pv. dysoxyli]NAP06765.1 DUF1534 domain-containing protein [Pseudomonas syringae]NAP21099.1 DUF1534 domain-containing protein [Pseudomonas syringae]NAP27351.1 DUF1534 domain-containing protein [Pseudomonas syringae]NAP50287.1 DUF1534 domain-containing protein [Pseudomonas syringae]